MKKRIQAITNAVTRTYSGMSTTRRFVAVFLASATITGLIVVFFAVSGTEPRARQYTSFKSCLLTDSKGIAQEPASFVWDGMQRASLETLSKVQYLANTEVKSTNALPYLGTLLQTRCNLIIAVGKTQTAAVATSAPSHPRIRFVVVGAAVNSPNVTSLDANPVDLPNQVAELIIDAND